jgi:hypothetical protein
LPAANLSLLIQTRQGKARQGKARQGKAKASINLKKITASRYGFDE